MRRQLKRVIGKSTRRDNGGDWRHLRRRWMVLALSVSGIASMAFGASRTWTDGTGNWNTPGNWSGNLVPTTGDFVAIDNADGTARTVTYDYTGPAVSLGGMIIDQTGAGSAADAMTMSANVLSLSDDEEVGSSGRGSFLQSGGSQSVGTASSEANFHIGSNAGSQGSYSLSGSGNLAVFGYEFIGEAGTGSFTQSGGTNTVGTTATNTGIFIGGSSGSNGSYVLTGGGVLLVNGTVEVGGNAGPGGKGILSIGGGSMTVAGTLQVDNSSGTAVNLSSGLLSVQMLDSTASQSRFFGGWSGGTLAINGPGTSNLGSPSIGSLSGVTLSHTGGTVSVGGLVLAPSNGTSALYSLSNTGNLVDTGALTIGGGGIATFNQTGGAATIGTAGVNEILNVGSFSNGSYTLSAGSLTVNGREFMGDQSTALFVQSGGTHTITGTAANVGLYFCNTNLAKASYSLSNTGVLAVQGVEEIGINGPSTFIQSGGTHIVGTTAANNNLYIGFFSSAVACGTYTLSGSGNLTVNGSEDVGHFGTGSFTQGGGTHSVTGKLTLAASAGAVGSYVLSSGKLSTGSTTINTNGSFQFNGGTASLGNLTLAGTGQLLMSAGHDKALVLNSLSVASGANLDVADNSIIVNYGAETTNATRDAIRNLLMNGRNAAPAAPAPWNGIGGIMSSFAHTNGNGSNLAIGYADNATLATLSASGSYTSFGGQTVGSTTILVAMTRGADCNLDGNVDSQDVSIIATHFNKPGSGQWYFGDFDYSGMCDSNDVSVLATTFGKTSPTLSPAQLSAEFGSAFAEAFETGANGSSTVPEAGSLTLISLGGAALMGGRRKRWVRIV